MKVAKSEAALEVYKNKAESVDELKGKISDLE